MPAKRNKFAPNNHRFHRSRKGQKPRSQDAPTPWYKNKIEFLKLKELEDETY